MGLQFVNKATLRVVEPGNKPSYLLSILPDHISHIQESQNFDDLIHHAFNAIHPVLQLNCVSLYEVDEQNDTVLHLLATQGSAASLIREHFQTIEMEQPLFSIDDSASQPIYLLNSIADERAEEEIVEASALKTLLHCQLAFDGGKQGTFAAGTYFDEGLVQLSDEEIAYFGAIAKAVSMAIDHLRSSTRSMTDPLTHVSNRRGLEVRFDQLAKLAERNKTAIGLIYLDIDNFKVINDRQGHAAGDEFLQNFAQLLKTSVRESDVVSRLGGDEFAIALPVSDARQTDDFVKNFRDAIERFINASAFDELDFSIGLAIFPKDGQSLKELLSVADRYMYEQKRSHK